MHKSSYHLNSIYQNSNCYVNSFEKWVKIRYHGVPYSSVAIAGVPCAEVLQRTRVRLLVWVPLLRVTPPLSHPVSCHPLQLYCQ